MNFSGIVTGISSGITQLLPLARIVWVVSVVLGAAMLILALFLKKNPARKNSPWIVGGIGLLMVISSGTQLIMNSL